MILREQMYNIMTGDIQHDVFRSPTLSRCLLGAVNVIGENAGDIILAYGHKQVNVASTTSRPPLTYLADEAKCTSKFSEPRSRWRRDKNGPASDGFEPRHPTLEANTLHMLCKRRYTRSV